MSFPSFTQPYRNQFSGGFQQPSSYSTLAPTFAMPRNPFYQTMGGVSPMGGMGGMGGMYGMGGMGGMGLQPSYGLGGLGGYGMGAGFGGVSPAASYAPTSFVPDVSQSAAGSQQVHPLLGLASLLMSAPARGSAPWQTFVSGLGEEGGGILGSLLSPYGISDAFSSYIRPDQHTRRNEATRAKSLRRSKRLARKRAREDATNAFKDQFTMGNMNAADFAKFRGMMLEDVF